jgi:Flp pilus assembly protein TadD
MNRAEKRRQQKLAEKAAKREARKKPGGDQLERQQQLAIQLIDQAVQHQNAGELRKAEVICQQILQADPNQPVALHLLGVIASQAGKNDIAVEFITKSLAIKPDFAAAHHNLGIVFATLGRFEEAESAQRKAVALKPGFAEAWLHMSRALRAQARMPEAEEACRRVVALRPNHADAHNSLGIILRANGRMDEAAESFHRAVSSQPNHVAARSNLGASLIEKGQDKEALSHLLRAAELSPGDAEIYNNVGSAYEAGGNHKEAEVFFRRAIEISPGYAQAHANLALALRSQGRLEESEIFCRQAAQSGSDDPSAHLNLGKILVERGNLEEAVSCFRSVLALQPDNVDALYELAISQRDVLNDDDLTRMEDLLRTGTWTRDQQVKAHFALAWMYEGRGDTNSAFSYISNGNALRRKALAEAGEGFDPTPFADFATRIAATFSAMFLDKHRGTGNQSDLPVFIVGMPRSGTTLIEQIVASHPQVHGAGELNDIGSLAVNLPGRLRADDAFPECLREMDSESIQIIARDYLAHLHRLGGTASRVTDKMPFNFRYLGFISLLFPKARVIHCRRDAMDTGFSCFQQNFTTAHSWSTDLGEIGLVHRSYETLMAHWRAVLPIPMLEVDYETVIANQEQESRRMIEFLGLPWDDVCLFFHHSQRPVRTASDWQVRRPIYGTSVGRWRAYERYLDPLREALDGKPHS